VLGDLEQRAIAREMPAEQEVVETVARQET